MEQSTSTVPSLATFTTPTALENQLTVAGTTAAPATVSAAAAPVSAPTMRTLFFTVSGRHEVAVFSSNITANKLEELFRGAAEAEPGAILKLYTSSGALVNISPDLPPNSPDTRYTLDVVSTSRRGMLQRELGVDLGALEQRVCQLEKVLRTDREDVSQALTELRQQIDLFRTKLETAEHLNWLGNDGYSLDLNAPDESRNWVSRDGWQKYARRSHAERQRIKEKFLDICDMAVPDEVRAKLRNATFDSREWKDEELLLLLQQMYIDLELISRFNLDVPTLRCFLFAVYDNYNDVPFHNFRHCFCVAQMMYAIAWTVDLSSRVGDLEILILITSCICHDLDHPGYNNIYQINARTELALRYNDISPLENHHCSVAFRLLCRSDCNIFRDFSRDMYCRVREGMIRCILATDMARHNEILQQFQEITSIFDFENPAHTNLLSMVLIKVADISNEARPMEVAEPWLDRLLQEFFKQSDTEKQEGLPVTPFMDRDKVTKPSSQCSFIGLVLLPLFEALGELLPELKELIIKPVHFALEYYRRLNEAARERKSLDLEERRLSNAEGSSSTTVTLQDSATIGSGTGINSSPHQSRASRQSCFATTRSFENFISEDQAILNAAIDSTEEEDTVTEVEVSEKTLKFKISTETSSSRFNYRQSSLDKQPSLEENTNVSPAYHMNEQTMSNVPQANGTPLRNSFFSRLKCFRERLYNIEKSPEKNKVRFRKKEYSSSERRRSSSSSVSELKQSVSDDISNGKSKTDNKKLSGSLDCVLNVKDKHSSKKGILQRLKGGEKSSTTGNRSPGSKVASFVGSFRKRVRDENK